MPRAVPAGCPTPIAACVGGGSNAIGLFTAFLDDADVAIYGFEPGGDGVETGRHAATIHAGDSGVLHGARTFVLQDEDGQTIESHSISAGLDYPGVGPQHAHLADDRPGDVPARSPTPRRWTRWRCSARTEGIIPAIESAHAVAGALRRGPRARPRGRLVLVNLSGRGDKDMETAIEWFGLGDDGRAPTASADGVSVATAFEKARAEGRAALVGYLPAGFPDVARRHRRAARRWSTPAAT